MPTPREAERRQSTTDLARNASYTISEWCALRRISRAQFYVLDNDGLAPKTYNVGLRRYISPNADAEWLAQREAAAAS